MILGIVGDRKISKKMKRIDHCFLNSLFLCRLLIFSDSWLITEHTTGQNHK